MNKEYFLGEINFIISGLLSLNNLNISFNTKLDEIEDWDSLAKIQLVFELERKFDKKFSAEEIQNWIFINDIYNSLTTN
jgi:acyl carrier protein